MNSCTFTGNLGRDPELRQTRSGHDVCSFSLAVKRYGKDDPLWLDVSVWGKQGENVARYLSKGSPVAVSGVIDLRSYEKRDGGEGFALDLNAREVTFLGSKDDGGGQRRSQSVDDREFQPASSGRQATPDDDDIPF